MLLMPNKKKVATIIVGKMKPDFVQRMGDKSEGPELPDHKDEETSDVDAAMMQAMQSFISAAKEEDVDAMASHFKDAVIICMEAEKNAEPSEEYGE